MANAQQQEETYRRLMLMFDLVEEMIKAIDQPAATDAKDQLQLAERFIQRVGESTETILTAYMECVKRGAPTLESSKVIEDAARKIFIDMARLVAQARQLKPAA